MGALFPGESAGVPSRAREGLRPPTDGPAGTLGLSWVGDEPQPILRLGRALTPLLAAHLHGRGGAAPLSLPPGSTCSPRCPASGFWCVAGTARWAGCWLRWRRCGPVWPARSPLWPSCPWAQVGSAGELGAEASGLIPACPSSAEAWAGGSACILPLPQGTTLAGSSAGGQATAAKIHCPCWRRWMRLTLCSWTGGPSCWTPTRPAARRTAWRTWSPPGYQCVRGRVWPWRGPCRRLCVCIQGLILVLPHLA